MHNASKPSNTCIETTSFTAISRSHSRALDPFDLIDPSSDRIASHRKARKPPSRQKGAWITHQARRLWDQQKARLKQRQGPGIHRKSRLHGSDHSFVSLFDRFFLFLIFLPAPEVIACKEWRVGLEGYGLGVDMWSIGVILFVLSVHSPLSTLGL